MSTTWTKIDELNVRLLMLNAGIPRELAVVMCASVDLFDALTALEIEISSRFAKGEAGLRDMSEQLRKVILQARAAMAKASHE